MKRQQTLDNRIPCSDQTEDLESLQFFQTLPHQCSYLPNKVATTAFLNPKQTVNKTVYSQLSEHGFRRSGQHIYKLLCHKCNACIPLRIPAYLFGLFAFCGWILESKENLLNYCFVQKLVGR